MAILNFGSSNVIWSKYKDVLLVLNFQLVLMALFGVFARYEDKDANFKLQIYPNIDENGSRYGFSAVGFNFLLAAIIVQWAIICEGAFELPNNNYKIPINMLSLLRADVASATVLISMGALLGNVSYVQLIVMGFIEIIVFSANSYLGTKILKVVDAGDSIFVHAFGAYFGLAVSYVLGRKNKTGLEEEEAQQEENQLEGSSYTSDLFAMIGTVFLWMFWPSFNSAELEGDQQMRAIINTYLSLTSCCVASFIVSSALSPDKKFDMVHVQNSTLAGGVAIGTSANLMLQPLGALSIGLNAGILSVLGYNLLTPILNKKFHIHDTCGVHNLHGMPAIMAGLAGAVMAGLATENDYHTKLYQVFPARAATEVVPGPQHPLLTQGDGRTALEQAGYQILAVVLTLGTSIISGLITGNRVHGTLYFKGIEGGHRFIIRNISPIDKKNAYADDISWQIHESHPTASVKEPVEKEPEILYEDDITVENTHEMAIQAEIPPKVLPKVLP
ncbi:ammonium transporter [Holotrichia oblita]|uniref:Ammonium transporter n=1 Tax=Holotrichia oblita TaxID=644536 RepID=A0ACB9T6C6_HOLOL|nr:ammonium transporter [Holotrichia oblita]